MAAMEKYGCEVCPANDQFGEMCHQLMINGFCALMEESISKEFGTNNMAETTPEQYFRGTFGTRKVESIPLNPEYL